MTLTGPSPSSVLIVADTDALSALVPALAAAIASEFSARVKVRLAPGGSVKRSTALDTLLSLETLLVRRGRPGWSDPLSPTDLGELLDFPAEERFSLVVDLSENPQSHVPPVYRPVYNGGAGEQALASALFFHGTPEVAILHQPEASEEPVILERGTASLEAAEGMGGMMEAVWSRMILLLVKAVRRGVRSDFSPQGRSICATTPMLSTPGVLRHSAAAVAKAAARAAYGLCCHRPHWRVGWRYAGPENDVWAQRSLDGVPWNVLPDPIDHFYADPFPFSRNGQDYIFLEDLDHKTQKGIISVVEIDSSGKPGPAVPVLEESWHLSYPFLLEEEGELWMIPEASLSGEIAIYRAREFPWRWEKHATLVSGIEAADATIVRHNGRLWMFAVVRQGIGGYSDTLSIWSSEHLLGPWRAHPGNPVMIDDREARPAGAMIWRNGQLLRPVQDCRNGYGAALTLARVTRLDDGGFSQVVETHLQPGTSVWPGRKLHTLNGNGRLEVIDGSILRPRLPIARRLVDRTYQPAS